jgi:rhodanese-related sulfurtransferase
VNAIGISLRRACSAAVATLAVVTASAACGSGGGTSSSAGRKPGTTVATTSEAFARLDPATFAARLQDKGAVLVNVHVPYEGELADTDAFIPYDHIVGDARLPADKHTELLLYCRSGRMSEMAANALHGVGYTRLAHLEGGMRAWEASGHTLLHNPAHGTG